MSHLHQEQHNQKSAANLQPHHRSTSAFKKRSKQPFIANIFTKELKSGKLPFLESGDRLSRYGPGFSNLLQMAAPPLSTRLPHNHLMSTSVDHNDSIISQQLGAGSNDEGYLSQDNEDTQSKAAYALYRPELKKLQDPFTYEEAQRKYRRQGDPKMDEYARSLRNRMNIRRVAPNVAKQPAHNNSLSKVKASSPRGVKRSRNAVVGGHHNSMSRYLGMQATR